MTTRPRLNLGSHLLPGIAAVALFAVLAVVFLTASFEQAAGFPADASITANIGYALLDLQQLGTIPTEGFLVALIVIAVVLDAALDGAVMLARREGEDRLTSVIRTDGGRPGDASRTEAGTEDTGGTDTTGGADTKRGAGGERGDR